MPAEDKPRTVVFEQRVNFYNDLLNKWHEQTARLESFVGTAVQLRARKRRAKFHVIEGGKKR